MTDATDYPTDAEAPHTSAPDVQVGDVVLVPMDPATNNGSPEAPAVVVRVWSPTTVNLQILPDAHDSGGIVWRTSCTQVTEFEEYAPGVNVNLWKPVAA